MAPLVEKSHAVVRDVSGRKSVFPPTVVAKVRGLYPHCVGQLHFLWVADISYFDHQLKLVCVLWMRFFMYTTWCAVVGWIDLKTFLFVNKCFIRDEVNVTNLCDDFQYGRLGNVCCLWLVSVGWSEDEATASRRSKTAGVWWCGKALIFVQQALHLPSRVTLPYPQKRSCSIFFFERMWAHHLL